MRRYLLLRSLPLQPLHMIASLNNCPSGRHQRLVSLILRLLRGNDLLAGRDDRSILMVSTESTTTGQNAVALTHAAAGGRRGCGRVRSMKQTTATSGLAFGGDGLVVVLRRRDRGGGGSVRGVAAEERHFGCDYFLFG